MFSCGAVPFYGSHINFSLFEEKISLMSEFLYQSDAFITYFRAQSFSKLRLLFPNTQNMAFWQFNLCPQKATHPQVS